MNQQNHLLCSHCGSQAIEGISSSDSKYTFCCNGCKLIFFCIQDSGLHNFYDIMKSQGEKIVTASEEITEYEYLKEIDFHEKFSSGDSKNCYFFYIQGIECLACSWIFSNLTSINKDLKNSNFRSESNVLELTVDDHKSLYDIVKFVAKLGYKVVPIKNIEEANLHYQNEKKSDLIRIGITGSLWMNIMIFSVSLYSGASDYFTLYFKYIQALLFLPIMTFSSYPFYKNLITGLKNKKTSIDFPIVLSIILGSILSYLSLYKGGEKFYFDSISMFIF